MADTLTIGTELCSPNYKYRIDRVLGQGSFGITYLATMKVETEVKVHGPLGDITEKGIREVHVCIKEFFMKDMNSRESTGFVNETSSSRRRSLPRPPTAVMWTLAVAARG